jgi:hypothetical protein
VVAGVTLLLKASNVPPHVDEERAQRLATTYEEKYYDLSAKEREQQAQEIIDLRTSKWALRNLGVRLCLIGVTLALAIVWFRLWDLQNLRRMGTPQTKFSASILMFICWLGLILAFWFQLLDDFVQDDLRPHNNDQVFGLFLAIQVPAMLFIGLFSVFIYRYLIIRNASLPSVLWRSDYAASGRNVALTMVCVIFLIAMALILALSLQYFMWALPTEMVLMYVVLSTWAGLLNRKIVGAAPTYEQA